MRDQPAGVRRVRRGEERPAKEYGFEVDGELADGFAERLPRGAWRGYFRGDWRKFDAPGAFLSAMEWVAGQHRAAKVTAEPVTAAEAAQVRPVSPEVADPFQGNAFADPLA
jgi:hypothetical protein